MIEIKLKVPSSKEECNVSDCSVCDLNVLTCGDCEKIWEIGMDRMNSEDFPPVTPVIPLSPLPHAVFVPKLSRDGDMWCALYGENSMEGIVGFGKTPSKAIKQFDDAFYEDIVDNEVKEEVRKHPVFSQEIEDIRYTNGVARFIRCCR